MKKFSALSKEELVKRKSILKSALIALVLLGVIITVVMFFLHPKPVFYIPFLVLPVTWLPIFISLKSVSDEIEARSAKRD